MAQHNYMYPCPVSSIRNKFAFISHFDVIDISSR